jgi:hypothetical protein
MSYVRSVLSTTIAIVTPLALMLVGAVISFALFHGEGASQDKQTVPTHSRRTVAGDDSKFVHVALEIEEGEASKTMLIHGARGRELATFHVYRDGMFTLEPTASDPFGFTVHREESGASTMGVSAGQGHLLLKVRTDGSAEILFKLADGRTMHELRVDAEGVISSRPAPDRVDH